MTALVEWETSTVGLEFDVQLGKRLDAAVNRGELRWCINNRSVRWGRVLAEGAVKAPLTNADMRDLRLVEGDVLVCEGGEIGRAAVWHDDIPEAYFLNTLHRLRTKGRYAPELLVAVLERWASTGELAALVGKATLAHLTKENLLQVSLPVTPLTEQARIVRALTDVDELVDSLQLLIVKKQNIKRGITQELLSGQIRLQGFKDDWSSRQLRSIATGVRGAGLSKGDLQSNGRYPCILYGELFTTYNRVVHEVVSRTDQTGTVVSIGSEVLLPGSTTTSAEDLATATALLQSGVLLGGDINIIRPNRSTVDPVWLAYYLVQERNRQIAESSQGITIVHLYVKSLLDLEIALPPLEEQQAIAKVLLDADKEISALERQLKSARAIKQGMMQELLTGRTRLTVETAP